MSRTSLGWDRFTSFRLGIVTEFRATFPVQSSVYVRLFDDAEDKIDLCISAVVAISFVSFVLFNNAEMLIRLAFSPTCPSSWSMYILLCSRCIWIVLRSSLTSVDGDKYGGRRRHLVSGLIGCLCPTGYSAEE